MAQVTLLHKLRKNMGLSQSDVEKQIGIPHSLYSALEQGRLTKPYDYMKDKLLQFFGVEWEKLLTLVEDDVPLIEVPEAEIDQGEPL